jgi:hypothetical protein
MTGLSLGLSYEARARIAIAAGDRAALASYAPLAAREYRHGRGSSLGTRYERLMQEARMVGIQTLAPPADLETSVLGTTMLGGERATVEITITEALAIADGPQTLSERALALLCAAHGVKTGHLYLMRDTGLTHAASNVQRPPEEALHGLAGEFWQRHVQDPDLPTALLPESGTQTPTTDTLWTDSYGVAQRPLLLRCVLDGLDTQVGVLVLVADSAEAPSTGVSEAISAVCAYLMRTGAATGVTL